MIATADGAIVDVLDALERDGRLTPDEVIEAAKPEDSPLHDRFEWDDKTAAHEHRRDVARELIVSYRRTVTVATGEITTYRYVHDPRLAPQEQGYVSTERLRSDPSAARAMVAAELVRALAYLRRAEELAAVVGLGGEVSSLRKRAERLRARLRMKPEDGK